MPAKSCTFALDVWNVPLDVMQLSKHISFSLICTRSVKLQLKSSNQSNPHCWGLGLRKCCAKRNHLYFFWLFEWFSFPSLWLEKKCWAGVCDPSLEANLFIDVLGKGTLAAMTSSAVLCLAKTNSRCATTVPTSLSGVIAFGFGKIVSQEEKNLPQCVQLFVWGSFCFAGSTQFPHHVNICD